MFRLRNYNDFKYTLLVTLSWRPGPQNMNGYFHKKLYTILGLKILFNFSCETDLNLGCTHMPTCTLFGYL